VPVMRMLTILAFAAFIAAPTFVEAQSMTAQQYHKEKGPCIIKTKAPALAPRTRTRPKTNAEGGVPSVLEDEANFRARAPTTSHLPFLLGAYTGQRQFDLLTLPWSAYDGVTIKLK